MEREVKELLITFENCEVIVIPGNAIGSFSARGIHKEIRRVACNSISEYTEVDEIVMEIFEEGNQKYKPFGCVDRESETLTRISTYKDITSVTMKFTDQTEDSFLVCYDEGDKEGVLGAENINEDIYISRLGNIYIVVSNTGRKVTDYFDLKDIDNEETMRFRKDMYNIGVVEPETVRISDDNLPDFYQYVYLSFQDDNRTLAVRVEDPDSGWKWLYQDEELKGKIPVSWEYPNDKINRFIQEQEESGKMDIELMKEKYSMHEAGHWCIERWSDGDLEAALEDAEIPATEENVCKLRDACKGIFDDKSERNEAIAYMVSEVFSK